MKIGVLGTGMVGRVIGSKLIELGYDVKMGSRTNDNPKAIEWVQKNGQNASQGTFQESALFGEMVFNCTSGQFSLEALSQAREANLEGKILVDLANPLDFSKGMPPTLFVCNTDSLGEQIQRKFPKAKVVKTLNTLSCMIMVNPSSVPDSDIFICGNDEQAKQKVTELLKEGFGWQGVIDLGDISGARGTEMLLPIWLRMYGKFGNAEFNFKVARKS